MNEGVTYDIWFNTSDRGFNFLNHEQDSRAILSAFDVPKTNFGPYGVRLKTYFNVSKSLP